MTLTLEMLKEAFDKCKPPPQPVDTLLCHNLSRAHDFVHNTIDRDDMPITMAEKSFGFAGITVREHPNVPADKMIAQHNGQIVAVIDIA